MKTTLKTKTLRKPLRAFAMATALLAGPAGAATYSAGDTNFGVAAQDFATGTGFIMFSESDLHTRFAADPIQYNNADHFVAVVWDGTDWFYDDNRNYFAFTPDATDILVAEVDFSADTVTALQGVESFLNGIAYGYSLGDLAFEANAWGNPRWVDGEFGVTGTFLTRSGITASPVPVPASLPLLAGALAMLAARRRPAC